MDFENLDISPELREKAKTCKTPEELLALAKREGLKLNAEQLEEVVGGGSHVWSSTDKIACHYCGAKFSIKLDACPKCGLPAYSGPSNEY